MFTFYMPKHHCILLITFWCMNVINAQVSVKYGDLCKVSESEALMSMGGESLDKSIWFKFLIQREDPSAQSFMKYLVSSPIPERKLAEADKSSDLLQELMYSKAVNGSLCDTKNASLAEYHSVERIKSLGTMKVDLWVLLFVCFDSECRSVAPVTLQEDERSNLNYHTLGEFAYSYSPQNKKFIISNPSPSRLHELSKVKRVNRTKYDLMQFGSILDKGIQLRQCRSNNFTSFQPKSAPFDAYNYLLRCYKMDQQFKQVTKSEYLLVAGLKVFLPNDLADPTECYTQNTPVLYTGNVTYDKDFTATRDDDSKIYGCKAQNMTDFTYLCVQIKCVEETNVKRNLIRYFKIVFSDGTFQSYNCTSHGPKAMNMSFILDGSQSLYLRTAKELCLMGIGPHFEQIVPIPGDNVVRSLMILLKNLYREAHVSLLNLNQGPPAEFWTVSIALPSAFIAVVTATMPLTNFQLAKILPHEKRIYVVAAALCTCNLLLALISYSAAIAVAPDELQRQRRFQTWGLHADNIQGLEALVFFQGESVYHSRSLIITWVSAGLLFPVVVCITLNRCKQVFKRIQILRELRGDLSDLDYIQAVEMTFREFKMLLTELEDLRRNSSRNHPTRVRLRQRYVSF